jgi:hypothetical protein
MTAASTGLGQNNSPADKTKRPNSNFFIAKP